MDYKQLVKRALEIRAKYAEYEKKTYGKEWTREQIAEGLVSDVGDLIKVIMAKGESRKMEDIDSRLAHELSECLWCLLVLADKYGIDLEKSFIDTMNELGKWITPEG